MKHETRGFNTAFEVREEEGKQPIIEGYASVYDVWYDCGWYQEKIDKGAFNDAIMQSDIRALVNHDPNLILGRMKANTLMVSADEKGLRYIIQTPSTSYAKDLAISMKRGDIDQSSFAFTTLPDGENWEIVNDQYLRTITKVDQLYDVSPVTYPASSATESFARSEKEIKDELQLKAQAIVDEDIKSKRLREAEQEQLELEVSLMR